VGGQPGGPAHRTSHWLKQATTFEPSSWAASPVAGQPQPPEPCNLQGPQEAFDSPCLSSKAMNMHFEPDCAPLSKHWDWLIKPVTSEQAYSGCTMLSWCMQDIAESVTCIPSTQAPTFQSGISCPSIRHGKQWDLLACTGLRGSRLSMRANMQSRLAPRHLTLSAWSPMSQTCADTASDCSPLFVRSRDTTMFEFRASSKWEGKVPSGPDAANGTPEYGATAMLAAGTDASPTAAAAAAARHRALLR